MLRDALIELNTRVFPGSRTDTVPGGVTWWFKQDEIHQATHVHGGPEFLPWHREIVNRLEGLLRQINPQLSLHYWDWTQDPRAIPNANLGNGVSGTLNLFTSDFMGYGGSSPAQLGEPWRSARYYAPGANPHRDGPGGNAADPPAIVSRFVAGSPASPEQDQAIVAADDYPRMRSLLEDVHDSMHGFVNMGGPHISFRDPFVFLLHANVDRLFALWQTQPGESQRLDPNRVYGPETNDARLNRNVEPWSTGHAVDQFGVEHFTRPWFAPESEGVPKTYKDPSIVAPPAYDTPARRHIERSRRDHAPEARGTPAALNLPAFGGNSVVYRDLNGHLDELWQGAGGDRATGDATLLGGAPPAAGDPSIFFEAPSGKLITVFRAGDGNVHGLYWSTGPVGHDNITGSIGAPQAAGEPRGCTMADGISHVIYRSGDSHLHALWWSGGSPAGHDDLTKGLSAPPAAGDPSPWLDTTRGRNHVAYRATDGHVRGLFWNAGPEGHEDLSGFAGAPNAAGDPVAYYLPSHDLHQITYRGVDRHLWEVYCVGEAPVAAWDLTASAGAPPADSDPAVYYSAASDTKHVVYRSADGHLHEIWWAFGAPPTHVDVTVEALAPPAVDRPAALAVDGPNTQHVIYRGADNQIHEITWT